MDKPENEDGAGGGDGATSGNGGPYVDREPGVGANNTTMPALTQAINQVIGENWGGDGEGGSDGVQLDSIDQHLPKPEAEIRENVIEAVDWDQTVAVEGVQSEYDHLADEQLSRVESVTPDYEPMRRAIGNWKQSSQGSRRTQIEHQYDILLGLPGDAYNPNDIDLSETDVTDADLQQAAAFTAASRAVMQGLYGDETTVYRGIRERGYSDLMDSYYENPTADSYEFSENKIANYSVMEKEVYSFGYNRTVVERDVTPDDVIATTDHLRPSVVGKVGEGEVWLAGGSQRVTPDQVHLGPDVTLADIQKSPTEMDEQEISTYLRHYPDHDTETERQRISELAQAHDRIADPRGADTPEAIEEKVFRVALADDGPFDTSELPPQVARVAANAVERNYDIPDTDDDILHDGAVVEIDFNGESVRVDAQRRDDTVFFHVGDEHGDDFGMVKANPNISGGEIWDSAGSRPLDIEVIEPAEAPDQEATLPDGVTQECVEEFEGRLREIGAEAKAETVQEYIQVLDEYYTEGNSDG